MRNILALRGNPRLIFSLERDNVVLYLLLFKKNKNIKSTFSWRWKLLELKSRSKKILLIYNHNITEYSSYVKKNWNAIWNAVGTQHIIVF